MLMREWPMTIDDLAKKSGVTKRMIQYVLNKERVPSIDVAAALAGAFSINGWQLLVPNLKSELARCGQLEKLVQNYQRANLDAQRYLDGVAERESIYNSQK
jgi:transcriptional regulator with XRE-family HTH domain